ncbi:unnamed protein product [Soboliphyme baturini]|uniref:H/ACA ribonucleoprotein complex subunit n=1 Tax=Soboliphyme baturini TaxID=241478 RepID=A0A183J1N2_9BILA|nr:unnamed protein product [Soboliphyme baturini]
MGFGGGGRSFGRGGGGRGFGGRGRGGGGHRNFAESSGPPEHVIEFAKMTHLCQQQLVCDSVIEKVPYFNAPVYLENKEQIGKVDEIFGTMNSYSVSVTLSENMKASSFKPDDKADVALIEEEVVVEDEEALEIEDEVTVVVSGTDREAAVLGIEAEEGVALVIADAEVLVIADAEVLVTVAGLSENLMAKDIRILRA